MAEVVIEALISLGVLGAQRGMQGYERWRDEMFFGELPASEKSAFLEVVIAAIFQDGELSAAETRWLQHREDAGAARELIDAAIETVKRALPEASSPEDYVAFVAKRAQRLGSEESQRRAFVNACRILLAANGNDALDTARHFGDGLGISAAEVAKTIGTIVGASERAVEPGA